MALNNFFQLFGIYRLNEVIRNILDASCPGNVIRIDRRRCYVDSDVLAKAILHFNEFVKERPSIHGGHVEVQ